MFRLSTSSNLRHFPKHLRNVTSIQTCRHSHHQHEPQERFTPPGMIDLMFDYGDYLKKCDFRGGIASAGPRQPKTVGIIGGGVSGLVAAYELSRIENISVTILEANATRMGGRMHSHVIKDDGFMPKVLELGCMRFPVSSHTMFHYLTKFDMQVDADFPDPGKVKTKLFYQGNIIDWPAGASAPDDDNFERIGEDFVNIMNDLIGDYNNPRSHGEKLADLWAKYKLTNSDRDKRRVIREWQCLLNRFAGYSYRQAIFELAQNRSVVRRPWDLLDIHRFGALGMGSGGFGPLFPISFIELLRISVNSWEHEQQFLNDGISSLGEKFISETDAVIQQGVLVTGVEWSPSVSKYLVHIDGVSNSDSPSFDSLIVTPTCRASQFMGLNGKDIPISQEVKSALQGIHETNSSKLFITTKSKFWLPENNPDGLELPQNIQTDRVLRGLYCLDYDVGRTKDGKGVVLVSYTWGDDATKLTGVPTEERYKLFLRDLREIDEYFANTLDSNKEEVEAIDWQATSLFYGAFKLNYPGQDWLNRHLCFQFQKADESNGLIFAGEAASFAGGWMEGAMTSGVNAAVGAAKYCGATLHESIDSPLDIDSEMYEYDDPYSEKSKAREQPL